MGRGCGHSVHVKLVPFWPSKPVTLLPRLRRQTSGQKYCHVLARLLEDTVKLVFDIMRMRQPRIVPEAQG
jgi:hypothetical protein